MLINHCYQGNCHLLNLTVFSPLLYFYSFAVQVWWWCACIKIKNCFILPKNSEPTSCRLYWEHMHRAISWGLWSYLVFFYPRYQAQVTYHSSIYSCHRHSPFAVWMLYYSLQIFCRQWKGKCQWVKCVLVLLYMQLWVCGKSILSWKGIPDYVHETFSSWNVWLS